MYIYRNGFARFSNYRYSNNPSDIANSFIHLTNVAIQKTAENYNNSHGGKWDLRSLKLYMMSKHGTNVTDKLFYDIQMTILRSLLCVQKIMISDKHCFELYGYDIMIDDQLKPWLIEVNASPSLSANTAQDYQLKCGMLNDMLDVIDCEKRYASAANLESKLNCVGEKKMTLKSVALILCTKTVMSHHQPNARTPPFWVPNLIHVFDISNIDFRRRVEGKKEVYTKIQKR